MDDVILQVQDLVKIFGPSPRKKPLQLLRAGVPKDDVLRQTGHVIGVNNVSFTVERGEIFVVMGLSGSGKSTLIRCINRLIPPTAGHVYLDGEDVAAADMERLRELRRTKMAMVFQHFGLFPHRTVADNVAYGLKIRRETGDVVQEKVRNALDLVGLAEWADYYPDNLSGGMQQRVGLARALATEAEVLLMDEAFSALDPLIRRQMQDELLLLQDRLHKTVLFITHDLNEALRIGNHIAVMRDGEIVQIGTPADIVTRPADEYVAEFTQDVDTGRVLGAEFVMKPARALRLDGDTVQTGLSRMRSLNIKTIYVEDQDGQVAGLVHEKDLNRLAESGENNLRRAVKANYTSVPLSAPLTDIYGVSSRGIPVAVVDDRGRLRGVIHPLDVLASLASDNEIEPQAIEDTIQ